MRQRVCLVGRELVFEFLQDRGIGFTHVFGLKNKRVAKVSESLINKRDLEDCLDILPSVHVYPRAERMPDLSQLGR
jgi:hypothetical protein